MIIKYIKNLIQHLEKKSSIRFIIIGLVGVFLFTQLFDVSIKPRFSLVKNQQANIEQNQDSSNLEEAVLPLNGITLPIRWGNLGKVMVEAGVIDKDKFESVYAQRGGLDENAQKLLYGERNGKLKIDQQNSGFLLNLFWAFGLANKNHILEEGPMQDSRYGGAGNFASTGGWILAKGSAMEHYNAHTFVTLTEKQQDLVEKVSKNIYRPCCGNSTYFPDCNHGMAMLGLLELMASQGASEKGMYKVALQVNSYWFPDTYLTIAKYFNKRGVDWDEVNPKEILSSTYSSAQGYQKILTEINPSQFGGGGSCGV